MNTTEGCAHASRPSVRQCRTALKTAGSKKVEFRTDGERLGKIQTISGHHIGAASGQRLDEEKARQQFGQFWPKELNCPICKANKWTFGRNEFPTCFIFPIWPTQ
jgi:hypothetical protein